MYGKVRIYTDFRDDTDFYTEICQYTEIQKKKNTEFLKKLANALIWQHSPYPLVILTLYRLYLCMDRKWNYYGIWIMEWLQIQIKFW